MARDRQRLRQELEEGDRADEEALEVERERNRLTRRRAQRMAQQVEQDEDDGESVVESLRDAFKTISQVGSVVSDLGGVLAPGLEGNLRAAGDIAISGVVSQIPGLGAFARDVQAGVTAENIVEGFAQRAGQAGITLSDERIVALLQRQAELLERGLEQRDRVRGLFSEVNPVAAGVGASIRAWAAIKGFVF